MELRWSKVLRDTDWFPPGTTRGQMTDLSYEQTRSVLNECKNECVHCRARNGDFGSHDRHGRWWREDQIMDFSNAVKRRLFGHYGHAGMWMVQARLDIVRSKAVDDEYVAVCQYCQHEG